jgi:hypothetical protein
MDSPAVTAGAGRPMARMAAAALRAAYAHGMISLAGTALVGMHSVYVFNAKGGMVAGADALTTSCNLEAGFLATGIYVVHVQALGASYSSRISVN